MCCRYDVMMGLEHQLTKCFVPRNNFTLGEASASGRQEMDHSALRINKYRLECQEGWRKQIINMLLITRRDLIERTVDLWKVPCILYKYTFIFSCENAALQVLMCSVCVSVCVSVVKLKFWLIPSFYNLPQQLMTAY